VRVLQVGSLDKRHIEPHELAQKRVLDNHKDRIGASHRKIYDTTASIASSLITSNVTPVLFLIEHIGLPIWSIPDHDGRTGFTCLRKRPNCSSSMIYCQLITIDYSDYTDGGHILLVFFVQEYSGACMLYIRIFFAKRAQQTLLP
jgi:hypothetical protein